MNTGAFLNAYHASRNGTNQFYRHPINRSFVFSDGVRECAEAGCYWLLDILATELPGVFRRQGEGYHRCIVTVTVKNESATIKGEFMDDDPKPYKRAISYTDLPEGEWKFMVTNDDPHALSCILLSEY